MPKNLWIEKYEDLKKTHAALCVMLAEAKQEIKAARREERMKIASEILNVRGEDEE